MIVCLCHRVSHHDIASAVRRGCETFDALQDELRVATGCGACADCARDVLTACLHGAHGVEALLPFRPRRVAVEPLHA